MLGPKSRGPFVFGFFGSGCSASASSAAGAGSASTGSSGSGVAATGSVAVGSGGAARSSVSRSSRDRGSAADGARDGGDALPKNAAMRALRSFGGAAGAAASGVRASTGVTVCRGAAAGGSSGGGAAVASARGASWSTMAPSGSTRATYLQAGQRKAPGRGTRTREPHCWQLSTNGNLTVGSASDGPLLRMRGLRSRLR